MALIVAKTLCFGEWETVQFPRKVIDIAVYMAYNSRYTTATVVSLCFTNLTNTKTPCLGSATRHGVLYVIGDTQISQRTIAAWPQKGKTNKTY